MSGRGCCRALSESTCTSRRWTTSSWQNSTSLSGLNNGPGRHWGGPRLGEPFLRGGKSGAKVAHVGIHPDRLLYAIDEYWSDLMLDPWARRWGHAQFG
jgi:hypothetical protein